MKPGGGVRAQGTGVAAYGHDPLRTLARIRGTMVGGGSAGTATGAHTIGHGMLPDTGSLLLMVAVCAALGWAVTGRSPRGGMGMVSFAGLLIAGQLLAHCAMAGLSGELPTHGGVLMLVAHTAATALTVGVWALIEATAHPLLVAVLAAVMALATFAGLTRLPVPTAELRLSWTARRGDPEPLGRGRRVPCVDGTRGPPFGPVHAFTSG